MVTCPHTPEQRGKLHGDGIDRGPAECPICRRAQAFRFVTFDPMNKAARIRAGYER